MKLNFSHPLYVSSGSDRDVLKIKIKQPNLFRAKKDGLSPMPPLTLTGKIPLLMADEEEFR